MKTSLFLMIAILATFLSTRESSAYVLATNSTGSILHWPSPVQPTFYTNWNNSSSLSYSDVFNTFTNSLQRWRSSGAANISFDYYQSSSHPTNVGNDGMNAIFFSSQSSQKMGSTTIGVTYVFSSGGAIVETDLEFNDEAFTFSTNPTESSQWGSFTRVFLENVATHEIGHAYGLAHSAVLQSSMVFLENRGQSKISCDDIQAIADNYPLSSFASGRGSLSGSVAVAGPSNVFGAHVLAISKTRGTVVSSAITQSNGSFSIPNLEPGDYYIMVEPFQMTSPIAALCGGSASGCIYGAVNSTSVCGGSPFKRGFVESSPGVASSFRVSANINTSTGSLQANCSAMSDSWSGANNSIATAPAILSNNGGSDSKVAVWGVAGAAGSSQYFKLSNVAGNISVKMLSYSLYSPIDAKVSIVDAVGSDVLGALSTDNVYSNSSSYVNYDSSASLSGATGDYYIKVTNNGNLAGSPKLYPAGTVGYFGSNPQIDATRYYLLIVTINDSTTLMSPTANARCEATDSFSAFPDKGPGNPNPASTSSSNNAEPRLSGGGCGTISSENQSTQSTALRSFIDERSTTTVFRSLVFSLWGFVGFLLSSRYAVRLARRFNAR